MTKTRHTFRYVSLGLTAFVCTALVVIGANSGALLTISALASSYLGSSTPEIGQDIPGTELIADDILQPTLTNGKIVFSSGRAPGSASNLKVHTMNADGSGVTCLMCGTGDTRIGRLPAISPNGSKIVYVDTASPTMIHVMDADGNNDRVLTTGSSPVWSPQSDRILFTRSVSTPTPHNELFIISADGGVEVPLNTSTSHNNVLPAWSIVTPAFPDGRVAFRTSRDGNSEIYVIAPTAGQNFQNAPQINVTNNPATDSDPAWSPDGTKLAFQSDRFQTGALGEIYTMAMDPNPGSVTRLTTDGPSPGGFQDSSPVWAPDGTKIAYVSFRSNFEIIVINSATGAPVEPPAGGNITNNAAIDFDVDWAPGTATTPTATNGKIVYQRGGNSVSDLLTITPGGGPGVGIRPRGYHAAYSPDGTKIVYVDGNTTGSSPGDLMLMNADGTGVRSLGRKGFSPTWSPNGSRIAFIRGDFNSVGDDGKGELFVIDVTENPVDANEKKVHPTMLFSRPSWGGSNRIGAACMTPHPSGFGLNLYGICLTSVIPASSELPSNPPTLSQVSGVHIYDRDVSWSADGTIVAFMSPRDHPQLDSSQIYVMNPDGTGARRVTNTPGFKAHPSVSPDGTKIVFVKDGTQYRSNADLSIVNTNGSNGTSPEVLTNLGAGDSYPNWGPATAAPTTTDLFLTMDGPSQVVQENTAQYIINLVNRSSVTATNVRIVTDPLPTSVQFVTSGSSNNCVLGGDRKLTCTIGTVQLDTGSTIINLMPTETENFIFKATASSDQSEATPDPNTNSASVAVTVTPSSDVGITLLETPPVRVDVGQNITYRYFITNHGPSTAQGVVFQHGPLIGSLPNNVEFVPSLSTTQFNCRLVSGIVTCDGIGNIGGGTSRSITIVVRTLGPGQVSHSARVSINGSTDRDPSNNSIQVSTSVETPRPELEPIITAPASTSGEAVSFTIRVKNNGGPATGVKVVNDRRTANSTFVGTTCTNELGVTTCSFGNLSSGQTSESKTITVRPREGAPISLLFTASASEPEVSPDPHPNVVTVNVTVNLGVQVFGIEVTQTVQSLNNTMDLVAGKPTFVRAHVKATSPASENVRLQSAYITAKDTATNSILGTITNSNKGTSLNLLQEPKRSELDDSFYFQLPPEWTAARRVEFKFGTTPSYQCNEPDAVKDCAAIVEFKPRRQFSIKLLRIAYTDPAGTVHKPTDADVLQTVQELKTSFPLADFSKGIQTEWPTRQEFCTLAGMGALLTSIAAARASDCGRDFARTRQCSSNVEDFYFGLMPYAYDGVCSATPGAGGLGENGRPDGIKTDNSSNSSVAFARMLNNRVHELGHNFGLKHTCFKKNSDDTFAESDCGTVVPADGTLSMVKDDNDPNTFYGFDAYRETLTGVLDVGYAGHGRIYGPNTPDMMSYGPSAWPSTFNYLRLFNALAPQTSASAMSYRTNLLAVPADKVFVINGTINLDNRSGQFGGVFSTDYSGDLALPPSGSYSIRIEDSQGTVLGTYPFEPITFSGGELGGFSLTLPKDPSARRIHLLHNGQVLATRQASASPPTVTVTAPNGGETLNGTASNFAWNASDADGGPLNFTIEYSIDSGNTWTMLTTEWESNTYPVDLTKLRSSSQALIRVTASDGFNSSSDQSNSTFIVPSHGPQVGVLTPEADHVYVGDQPVALSGFAVDPDEGILTGTKLSWTSNLNGPLGTGESLSLSALTLQEGTHTITVTATDSTGLAGSASNSIRVFRTRPTFPAAMAVGSEVLAYTADFGVTPITPQTVAIRNSGDGDLAWTATANQPWMQLASAAGTAPSNVDVTINPANLPPGTYSGTVTINAATTPASSKVVNVNLTITAGPPSTIGGRVLTPDGRGLRNAVVSLVNSQGVSMTATTSSFGIFSFASTPDDYYTIRISSKRYRFAVRNVQISNDATLTDFVGLE